MPNVILLVQGPRASERAARVEALLLEQWPRGVLLTPSRAEAAARREHLLRASGAAGILGAAAMPLADFAAAILEGEGIPMRRLDSLRRRLLLDAWLREAVQTGRVVLPGGAVECPGLTGHLLRVITDLKQAAIEPETFRARLEEERGGDASPFDALVAAAYAAYQERLLGAGAFDVPGLFWAAAEVCRRGRGEGDGTPGAGPAAGDSRPAGLRGVEAIAFDGFDDFTPSEFRFIEALAGRVPRVIFGINYDDAPGRRDLYAKPERTVRRLVERFRPRIEICAARAPERFSSYCAAEIFWRDVPKGPAGLVEDVAFIPCAHPRHELETAARHVKELLLEGVAPEAIVVAHAAFEACAETASAIFGECGIPVRMRWQVPLASCGLGAFLRRFVEAAQGWARETVLDLFLNPRWLMRAGAEAAALCGAFPAAARAAYLLAGRNDWMTRLDAAAQRLESGGREEEAALVPAIRALAAQARRLDAMYARIPEPVTMRGFAEAMDELLDEFDAGAAATEALRGALAALAEAPFSGTFSRAACFERLGQCLRETTVAAPMPPRGVTLCPLSALRNRTFDHVFLCGLNEGLLPSRPALNAIYSEADIERLNALRIPLEGRRQHSESERLLYHHALSAARARLTLCWHQTDASGAETLPSPFLIETLRLFDGFNVCRPAPAPEDFRPGAAPPVSPRALLNAAVALGFDAPEPYRARLDSVRARAAIETRRWSVAPYDAYDGVLSGESAARAAVAKRYGPAHGFSAKQIEMYRKCPFQFFAGEVLKIAARERLEAEFDPRVRGLALHDALQRFHTEYRGVPFEELPGDAAATMRRCVAEAFAKYAWTSAGAPKTVAAAEERYMGALLERYLIVEGEESKGWTPSHFEIAFGRAPREGADPLSTDRFYAFDGAGETARFSGRVDRLDFRGDTARVVDYKTGGVPAKKNLTEGLDIQVTLYQWAVRALLLPERACSNGVYIQPGKKKRRDTQPGKSDAPDLFETAAREGIAAAVDGIRAGYFPPAPSGKGRDRCGFCAYSAICRFNENRDAMKRPDAALEGDA